MPDETTLHENAYKGVVVPSRPPRFIRTRIRRTIGGAGDRCEDPEHYAAAAFARELVPSPASRCHRLGLPYDTVAARMSAAVSTWASSIHSSAVWAWPIAPGPNTRLGTPAAESTLALVP